MAVKAQQALQGEPCMFQGALLCIALRCVALHRH